MEVIYLILYFKIINLFLHFYLVFLSCCWLFKWAILRTDPEKKDPTTCNLFFFISMYRHKSLYNQRILPLLLRL